MTAQVRRPESMNGPEGSIFLFNPLSKNEYDRRMFALMQGRGDYQGLELHEQEEIARELRLRLNVSMGRTASTGLLP